MAGSLFAGIGLLSVAPQLRPEKSQRSTPAVLRRSNPARLCMSKAGPDAAKKLRRNATWLTNPEPATNPD
jgi:hypothetical protein